MAEPQYRVEEIFSDTDAPKAQEIAKYEKVHPNTVENILKRFAPSDNAGQEQFYNKHTFGLFLPGKDLPEGVVHVQLMKRKEDENQHVNNHNLTGNINLMLNGIAEPLRAEYGPPNTAIFYSIYQVDSAPDNGVTLQNLIYGAIPLIKEKYGVTKASTLSPMRIGLGEGAKGFSQWLKESLDTGKKILTPKETEFLNNMEAPLPELFNSKYDLINHLHYNSDKMIELEKEKFNYMMCDLGTYYLANEKKSELRVLDTVENFHLRNGAKIGNVHYTPASRMTNSENYGANGLMVNYVYSDNIELLKKTGKAYINTGDVGMDRELKAIFKNRCEELGMPSSSVFSSRFLRINRSPDIGII